MKPVVVASAFVVLAAAVAAGVWLYLQNGAGGPGQPPAVDANDAELVALGRQVYGEHCSACHGANLRGEPDWQQRKPSGRLPAPPHDATGHTWHHADGLLFALTKYGIAEVSGRPVESDMPAFQDVLSDREIAASLAYIKSTWPLDIRRRHDAMNAQNAAQ